MIVRAGDLYEKEVICVKDGTKMGNMGDFEINTETGQVETIIIFGRNRLFGLLGREDDRVIPMSCVEVFGDEVILVDCEPPRPRRRSSKNFLSNLFS